MAEQKKEETVEKKDTTSVSKEGEKKEGTESKTEPSEQDRLQAELERVQKAGGGRTEAEKAAFSLKKNAERARELGIDPAEVLGIKASEADPLSEDDDKPVTVGMMKRLQRTNAEQSAIQLADDIQNETERELVKYHLQNSIKSTGIPSEDLKLARSIVNSVKNGQILEELSRRPEAKNHSNATGAPAKEIEKEEELTPQERKLMGKPWNLTKAEILSARKGISPRFNGGTITD